MQLLRMTMQKEQEGDSNANDVSQASPDPDPASPPATDHLHIPDGHQHRPLPSDPAPTSPVCMLWQASLSGRPQSGGGHHHSVSMPSDSRPGLTCPGTGLNSLSAALCHHDFCNTSFLTEQSGISSSPDVNCNTLTSRFKNADSLCSADRKSFNPLEVEQVPPDDVMQKISTDSCAPDRNLHLRFGDMENGGEPGSSVLETITAVDADQPGQEEADEADLSVRNSVDMDVEESDNDEEANVQSGNKPFTPYIPQTAADAGLAGRDQPHTSVDTLMDKLVDSSPAKIPTLSVPVKRSILSLVPNANLQSTSLHESPPIWTTLALHSAAKSRPQTSSSMEQQISAIQISGMANAHATCISDSLISEETGAIIEILNRNTSVSSKLMRPDSRFKCTSFSISSHSHSISSGFRSSSTASKRSPLHGTLRPRHGRMSSSALKKPDVILEALLEDECALYAGRLQSLFRNPMADCDRQETPDPVAKILNEGDDMHFIPICDDPARGCRPACEASTFVSCIPVWESVA